MQTPYSDNIIFFDTEFTHLDPKIGELLSIGMVKYTGEELYLEFEYGVDPHPWVIENVLPTLKGNPVSKAVAREQLNEFVGDSKPYLMAYVNQFDAIYWYELFEDPKAHPAFWIPIDFASVLFGAGYDPNSMGKDRFFEELGVDKSVYNLHNALDDAQLLSVVYKKFIELQARKQAE